MAIPANKIQKIKSELLSCIQQGQYKKIERLYPKYKNSEIDDVEFWRYFAAAHSERNNLNELAHCCRKILKITPDDFQTSYTLGAALQNTNNFEEAIKQYEHCLSINPQYFNAIVNCANLLFASNQFARSADYFSKAITLSDTLDLRMQYGEALLSSGTTEQALIQLKYILSQQPDNKKALFLTAKAYYESKIILNLKNTTRICYL